jgi:putative FmdB family regulatory protein
MPIYVYRCAGCSAETEKRQGFSDAPLTTCETCGGSLRRVMTPVGVIFKGSGFYSTDYKNGGKAKAPDGSKDSGSKDSGKADSSSSESKSSDSSAAKSEGGTSTSGDKASVSPAAPSGTKSE